MNSVVAASSILLVTAAITLTGCAHRQPSATGSHDLQIRDCVRSRISAAGFRVSEEPTGGRRQRRLVGRSGAGNEPVDVLTISYTDSVFTMFGRTSQSVDRSLEAAGDLPSGSRTLPKSARLNALEAKLATECRGYQSNPGVG